MRGPNFHDGAKRRHKKVSYADRRRRAAPHSSNGRIGERNRYGAARRRNYLKRRRFRAPLCPVVEDRKRAMNLISSARNLRRHLYPADGAVLSILMIASITASVAGRQVRWLLLAHLGLLAGYLVFVILAGRFSASPWVGWVRPLAAMMTVFALYCTIGLLGMSAMPYRSDPVLARIDTALFAGHNPTFFIQRWQTPGRVEFFAFFYALFIPYINFSLLLGSLGRPPLERDQFLTGWVFTYCICFLGCLFLPGQGPGGYFAGRYAVQLHGGYFFNTVVDTVAHSGGLMGIFPSLHVGSSVYLCLFDLRTNRLRGLTYLPVVLLIYGATIMLRYHYVTDVIAGTIVAVSCNWIGPRVFIGWARSRRAAGLPALPAGEEDGLLDIPISRPDCAVGLLSAN